VDAQETWRVVVSILIPKWIVDTNGGQSKIPIITWHAYGYLATMLRVVQNLRLESLRRVTSFPKARHLFKEVTNHVRCHEIIAAVTKNLPSTLQKCHLQLHHPAKNIADL